MSCFPRGPWWLTWTVLEGVSLPAICSCTWDGVNAQEVADSPCVACTARSPVAGLQIFGYLIAFGGVVWYNYQKLQGMRQSTPPRPVSANGSGDVEKQPLISGGGNKA